MSYVNLHKKYARATPKLFSLYQTAVSFYEAMKADINIDEKSELVRNTTSDRRNPFITFVKNNKYKIGLNLLSNRLRAVSNCIPKNSMAYSKSMFKTFCKINIIQSGLSGL